MKTEKELFANTVSDLESKGSLCRKYGGGLQLNMTECEKFGMTWGCREDCPVFVRKECEFQQENEQSFKRGEK